MPFIAKKFGGDIEDRDVPPVLSGAAGTPPSQAGITSVDPVAAYPCPASESIDDLPEEVRKNLRDYDVMKIDHMIRCVLMGYQGYINVDRIILDIWKHYQKSPNRARVLQRLRHFIADGQVKKQEGTQGNFTWIRGE